MKIPGILCLKSYCLKKIKDLDQMATTVRDCKLNAIDISGCHVDYQALDQHGAVISTLAKQGVSIVGNGVVGLRADPKYLSCVFAFARAARSPVISVHVDLKDHRESIAMACALAEDHDVKLAIHNHGGKHWHGASDALRYLLSLGSNRLGLCIDSGWALAASEDPVAWVNEFAPRVYAAHLKDFVFDRTGKQTDVVLGQGVLNLKGFITALTNAGFNGPLAIEYEGHESDVTPAIRACGETLAA